MNYNNIQIEAYATGTIPIEGLQRDLKRAEQLRFETFYPGGIYGSASFYVPRKVAEYLVLEGAKRIVFRNGLSIVYEGFVDNLEASLEEASEGVFVTANGGWGTIMQRRRWRKIWADDRINEDIWVEPSTARGVDDVTLSQKFLVDRLNRLRFTPKAEAIALNNYHRLLYTMPTGETVKRITFNYDFQEGTQNWSFNLFNVTSAADEWTISASGTGSQNITLGTPSQSIFFYFLSGAAQTPTSDGTYYGQVSNVMVYSETGSINLTEIVKDVRAELTTLNASEQLIASNALDLLPFYADGWETMADILAFAASFGDGSFNPWAVGLRDSEQAATPDGKPVIFCEQQPALTDAEYSIRLDDPNLVGQFAIDRDFANIYNWIIVGYQDARGFPQYVTPDDDANLKDAISVSDYGQRDYVLASPSSSLTTATNLGRSFLAENKDPKYIMVVPPMVKGYIRGKGGNRIPVSHIRSGERIRIENYSTDITADVIFLITHTGYDDTVETTTIQGGVPSMLPQYLARITNRLKQPAGPSWQLWGGLSRVANVPY